MSTQEYATATARIPGKKVPIVIVPGIMGSRLTDPATRALVWNPFGWPNPFGDEPGDFAANKARLGQVDQPLQPDETHKYAQVADCVRVDPINHYYNLLSKFYGDLAISLHYDLRQDLASRQLVPAVYCAGYDWRQSNDQSAQRLSTIVDEARADCDNEPVILVAHSMGGIVSRHYCKNLGGESKVKALFLIGSPTLGAVKAYLSMRLGLNFWDGVRRILNMNRADTKTFTRRMPSGYELLPTYIYCSQVRKSWATFDPTQTGFRDQINPGGIGDDYMFNLAFRISDNSNSVLFYNDIYVGQREEPTTRDAVRNQLTSAYLFHDGLSVGTSSVYMHPHTVAYYCNDQSTLGDVSIQYDGVVILRTNDIVVSANVSGSNTAGGDGTVPADSANPSQVSTPFIDTRNFPGVAHTDLPSSGDLIRALRAAIVGLV
jgi:pimeloyl-ACP methyl ester carboxylesterase